MSVRCPLRRAALVVLATVVGRALVARVRRGRVRHPTLTWYINPDNGGQTTLAAAVRRRVRRRVPIQTQILPNEADAQREQLVRRLAAGGLIDRPDEPGPAVRRRVRQRRLPAGDHRPGRRRGAHRRTCSTGRSRPRTGTTSWSRRRSGRTRSCSGSATSVAAAAGIDPTAPDFTWDEMIDAAESQDKRIGVQGRRYEGYMVWINALVESGGGQIITTPTPGSDATPDGGLARRRRRRRRRRPARAVVGAHRPTCRPPARRRHARCSRATPAPSW